MTGASDLDRCWVIFGINTSVNVMQLFQARWANQTGQRLLALILIIVGQVAWTQAALGQSCPKNTFEVNRQETQDKIHLRCACAPGTKNVGGRCKEYIPHAILKKATPFVVASAKGKVRAFIKSGGKEYEVSTKLVLAANNIVTGKDSYIVLQLPSGKRVTIGQNTSVTFGDPLDEYDLNILQIQGFIRFDKPGRTEEIRRLAQRAWSYSRAWIRKTMSRRFKVRTPYVCACVRGTDFFLEGTVDGDQIVHVIEGEIDLIPHSKKGGNTISLKAGQQALITKDGGLSRLADSQPSSLLNVWAKKTGLSKLPAFHSR